MFFTRCIFLPVLSSLSVNHLQVHQGKLHESEARRYFQQLIDAIDYCHSKGVFHRDLKVCCILCSVCIISPRTADLA